MGTALAQSIATAPEAIERMLAVDLVSAVHRLSGANRIWLVGTGTSQHAAELGALMLRDGGREIHWLSCAAFAQDGPAVGPDDGVLVLSHTTETSFARAARERAINAGSRLVSITGIGRGWTEAIQTVPAESSETYTVSYLAALVVLARLGLELGPARFSASELAGLPDRVRSAIDRAEQFELVLPARVLVVVGAGPAAITAREGALKFREAARLLSEGYEAEYLLHGGAVPLTADDGLLMLSPAADPDGLLGRLGAAAEQAGLRVDEIVNPPGQSAMLDQIPLTVSLQVLAARAAEVRGQDPDKVIVGPWADEGLWAAGSP